MIVRMVELTHQAVDVGRCVPTNVGDKQCNELWGHVVKHRAVNADLLQNVPWKAITWAKDKTENPALITKHRDSRLSRAGVLATPRKGSCSEVQTRREDFHCDTPASNSPMPFHGPQNKTPSWDSSPQDPAPPHCTTLIIIHPTLPCAHYSPVIWPSCSNWLSTDLTQAFCTNTWEILLDLYTVGSIHSGLSWNVLSFRPFPH